MHRDEASERTRTKCCFKIVHRKLHNHHIASVENYAIGVGSGDQTRRTCGWVQRPRRQNQCTHSHCDIRVPSSWSEQDVSRENGFQQSSFFCCTVDISRESALRRVKRQPSTGTHNTEQMSSNDVKIGTRQNNTKLHAMCIHCHQRTSQF